MISYSGDLEVIDGDFSVFADRLIIRDDEIAFSLSGIGEGYGEFSVEGRAFFNGDIWESSPVAVRYSSFSRKGNGTATIQFMMPTQTPKLNKCSIQGLWKENGETWKFFGKLAKTTNQARL